MRPEFWRDEVMAGLTASTRLTYVGLWCVADDEGYLEWRPRQMGADIYPYVSAGKRDKQMETELGTLVSEGRVRLLACGKHAVIPTLPKHRIAGGKVNNRVLKAHSDECTDQPLTGDEQVRTSAGDEQVRTGTADSVSESVSPSDSVSVSESVRTPRAPTNGANGHPDDTIHDVVHRLTNVYLAPTSKNGDRVTRWVDKLGRDVVERELRETANDLGGLPMTNQLLNSTEDRLFPALSAKPKTAGVTHRAEHSLSDEEVQRAFHR